MVRAMQAAAARAALVCLLIAGAARAAHAKPAVRPHPLHTTLAEIRHDAARRVVTVSLRVFADDFIGAVTRTPSRMDSPTPADSAMQRYVRERFGLTAPGAGLVALSWCGVKREAEVLLICLRGDNVRALGGAAVRNTLMSDVFTDQVNMVQANIGGRRQMLLFSRNDGPKAFR